MAKTTLFPCLPTTLTYRGCSKSSFNRSLLSAACCSKSMRSSSDQSPSALTFQISSKLESRRRSRTIHSLPSSSVNCATSQSKGGDRAQLNVSFATEKDSTAAAGLVLKSNFGWMSQCRNPSANTGVSLNHVPPNSAAAVNLHGTPSAEMGLQQCETQFTRNCTIYTNWGRTGAIKLELIGNFGSSRAETRLTST